MRRNSSSASRRFSASASAGVSAIQRWISWYCARQFSAVPISSNGSTALLVSVAVRLTIAPGPPLALRHVMSRAANPGQSAGTPMKHL